MNTEILLFLLGYPLSIFSNMSTDYLKTRLRQCEAEPLKALFIKAFFSSLRSNQDKLDEVGRKAVQSVESVIKRDPEKLFQVIWQCVGDDYSMIFSLREDNTTNRIAQALLDTFDFSRISLARSVIKDCLYQYELSFFSELTEKNGIHFILKGLHKFNSNMAKREDIDNLRDFLVRELAQHKSESALPEALRELVHAELSNPTSEYFSESIVEYMATLKKTVHKLTTEQFQIIHHLRYLNRVVISGCAGSGKTLLAAEKAIRLDQAGIKTLILCHNPHLAAHIWNLVSGSSVDVFDITSLVNHLLGKEVPETEGWNENIEPFVEDIEAAFDKVLVQPIVYEAIIVDEGQDFRELWWLLVEAILEHSKNRILYIFFDDNQALLPYRSKYPLAESPFSMSKNCRNGGKIFQVVRRFHPHSPLISPFLVKDGIAKLTVFEDSTFKTRIVDALQDAYRYAAHYRISVITTEASAQRSAICQLAFVKYPELNWRLVVLRDLSMARDRLLKRIAQLGKASSIYEIANRFQFPLGTDPDLYFTLPELSHNLIPTSEDVDAVCECASRLLVLVEGSTYPIVRFAVQSGRLLLLEQKGPHLTLVNASPDAKIGFYSHRGWANTLPASRTPTKIVPYSAHVSFDETCLPLYTLDMFKGLESDAVVLFVNSINKDLYKEMYVGASRAMGYLNIVINKSVLTKIHRLNDRSLFMVDCED